LIRQGYFLHSHLFFIFRLGQSLRAASCGGKPWPQPTGRRLKPREIASDNEDSAGWMEKATTLPTQVAAHFSFSVPT
jgi:hypothetical protein